MWGSVLEDLLAYAESHLNVAYTLQREVKPALTNFSQEELSKQVGYYRYLLGPTFCLRVVCISCVSCYWLLGLSRDIAKIKTAP